MWGGGKGRERASARLARSPAARYPALSSSGLTLPGPLGAGALASTALHSALGGEKEAVCPTASRVVPCPGSRLHILGQPQ